MFENSKIKFSPEHIPHLENFELMKDKNKCARNRFLELYQDKTTKAFSFTYSYWETEDLENYRNSELFIDVWTFTKNYSMRQNQKLWRIS
jgi:hypothetical protein